MSPDELMEGDGPEGNNHGHVADQHGAPSHNNPRHVAELEGQDGVTIEQCVDIYTLPDSIIPHLMRP